MSLSAAVVALWATGCANSTRCFSTSGTPPNALINADAEGVAIEGYDPTAYFLDGQARKGDAQFALVHEGVTYHFSDEAHRAAFQTSPSKYLPAYGGYCGYAAAK
ncbi:MAG: YHS domain-containing (seleno)protein, partial [Myxococcota bacterium]